jgi:GDSL-like Lipase/Acylhydrolase family
MGATAGITYKLARHNRFSGGSYVQMGTSVTSGTGTKRGHISPVVVGDRLGMSALNVGLPGACAGVHQYPDLNPLSLYALADAICSGDWNEQAKPFHNELRDGALSRLMTTGFATVTHLGLEYGTNDFHYNRPIGLDSDCSKDTFKGALHYSIRKFQATFPLMHVFLITPAWLLNENNLDSDEYPNSDGVFLKEYVDAMLRVAELHHVPCLDMWRTLGVSKDNYKKFTFDGTHPTDLGALQRGDAIASFMNANF